MLGVKMSTNNPSPKSVVPETSVKPSLGCCFGVLVSTLFFRTYSLMHAVKIKSPSTRNLALVTWIRSTIKPQALGNQSEIINRLINRLKKIN